MNTRISLFLLLSALTGGYSSVFAGEAAPNDTTTQSHLLDELVVTGQSIKIIGPGEARLYPLPKQKELASDLCQVIENMNVSMLTLVPNSLTVKTSSGEACSLYINGVPATTEELQNIPPSRIRHIDFLENPSDARFQGQRYVLNFILRTDIGGVTKISAKEQTLDGNLTDGGIFTMLNSGKVNAYLFAGGNVSSYRHGGETAEESFRIPGQPEVGRVSGIDGFRQRKWSIPVSARISYQSPKFITSHTLGYAHDRNPYTESRGFLRYGAGSQFHDSSYLSSSQEKTNMMNWNGLYTFYFPNYASLNVTTSIQYSHSNTVSGYNTDGLSITNPARENAAIYSATAYFSKWLNYKHMLSASAYAGIGDYRINYYTDGEITKYLTPYASLSLIHYYNGTNVRLTTTLGVEYTNPQINGIKTPSTLPVIGLNGNVKLGNGWLSAYSQYKGGAVSASATTPVVQRRNELMYFTGNPDLKPQKHLMAGAGWDWIASGKLTLSPNIRYIQFFDRLLQTYTPYEEGLLSTWENVGDIRQLTTSLTAALNLFGSKLGLRAMVKMDNYFASHAIYSDIHSLSGNVSVNYVLGNVRLNAYYSTPSRSMGSYYDSKIKTPSSYYLRATWYRGPWSAGITLSNLFRDSWKISETSLRSQYYDCNSTDFGTGYHRSCTLTLSYSFGFGKKVTPDQELNRSVYGNSAIMK